jgi:uncharacterized protein
MAGVISNTSPLIALHQIGRLSLLQSLFREVRIPPAVSQEAAPSLPELPTWIAVQALAQPIGSEVLHAVLGKGESEVLQDRVLRDAGEQA